MQRGVVPRSPDRIPIRLPSPPRRWSSPVFHLVFILITAASSDSFAVPGGPTRQYCEGVRGGWTDGRAASVGKLVTPLAVYAVAQWVPSVVSLGQWLPIRRLPLGLCTWRGMLVSRMAFTFDDGPSPETTPPLLDRLDELETRATFFCLGSQMVRYPKLVADVRSRGHQVETHGYDHASHLLRSPRWIAADLDRALAVMAEIGLRPRWLRPPYGQTSGATLWLARRRGLRVVLWSAWGREWSAADTDAVVRRIGPRLDPGAIVLLHDSDSSSPVGSARRALDSLGALVAETRQRGLQAVTLDELVSPNLTDNALGA